MNDDSGGPIDGPFIDARSPAERWAESGRAGFDRVLAQVHDARIDSAALTWMAFVVAYTVLEVYSALRASGFGENGGSTDWWTKLQLLTSSGGIVLLFGTIIGILLAVLFYGPSSRLVLRMALGAGVWVILTTLLGVAVAFHEPSGGSFLNAVGPGTEAKIVSALGSMSIGGLGLVVAVIAWRLALPGGEPIASTAQPERDGPEVAELS